MKNFYFHFGHNGWTVKFVDIFKYLKKISPELRMHGLIFGTNDFFLEAVKEFNCSFDKNFIDQHEQLIQSFLSKPIDLKKGEYFEKKYGNLWTFVNSERRYIHYLYKRKYQKREYSHNELLQLVIGKFDYFEKALANIDAVITTPPSSSWARIMSIVAIKNGVELINIDQVGFPKDRATLTNSYFQRWTNIDELFLKYKDSSEIYSWKEFEEAKLVINEFRLKQADPPWAVQKSTNREIKKWVNLPKISRYLKKLYLNILGKNIILPSAFLQIRQYLNSEINRFYVNKFFHFHKFDSVEGYYFYPLHLEPEASLMISGQRALNQQSLIQRIASQLPVGVKLIVKEHPTMVGWRELNFYKNLMKIPNVKLVDPAIKAKEIIKGSLGVFTVVGTVGWEAVNMKKPVLIFGEAFYKNLSMVRYVQDIDNISKDIDWVNHTYNHDEEILIKFQACIIKSSFNMPYSYFWGIADDRQTISEVKKYTHHSKKIADEIYKYIQSKML
jgi:hypothetical protein